MSFAQGESFQAHACFVTTVSPAEPTVARELRCKITRTSPGRGAAAAGIFFVTLLEDIADGSFDVDLNGNNSTAGVIVNRLRLSAFVWKITVFTVAAGALGLADLEDSIISVTLRRVDPA